MMDIIDFLLDIGEDGADAVGDSEIDVPSNQFEGVENGVFVGDEEELNEISEAGMIDGTDHIDSEDIIRDLSARNTYLEQIGLDEVPEGFEVHHIIPLSEGGTDDPSNMILLSEEDHDQITNQHRNFYNWNK